MSLFKTLAAVLALSLCLSAYQQPARADDGPGVREVIGAIGGAALGGFGGSQIGKGRGKLIATGVGAVAGMLIGRDIGRQLDRVSAQRHRATTQATLENARTGRTRTWRNPDRRTRGRVTPTRTYRTSKGPCRDYRTTVVIDGKAVEANGTACRDSRTGQWRIQ